MILEIGTVTAVRRKREQLQLFDVVSSQAGMISNQQDLHYMTIARAFPGITYQLLDNLRLGWHRVSRAFQLNYIFSEIEERKLFR